MKFPDLLQAARKLCVDMIALDAQRRRRPRRAFARVAAKSLQHQLNHVTLAMVRGRRMGENHQFHFICQLRFAIYARHEF
jgi:putative N-acetylmannosamine-6-phosphate epimerase